MFRTRRETLELVYAIGFSLLCVAILVCVGLLAFEGK